MTSKDCDRFNKTGRLLLPAMLAALTLSVSVCWAGGLQTVRLWSSAVVVDADVRVGDLCELAAFDPEGHERVRNLVVTASPPAGGSKVVTLHDVRRVLTDAGVNMAETIVKGAAECGVSRPRLLPTSPPAEAADEHLKDGPNTPTPVTLRGAVEQYFDKQLARYGGLVQVDFGRTAAGVLDLAGPEYTFKVRRRSGQPLGMIDVEVEVLRDGQVVQRLDLLANVVFSRDVVVARRAINQKAEIRPEDVQLTELTFDRLDQLGLTDISRAVGQRAKRFVPAGTMVRLRDLESVPLVKRGQLVEVYSTVGATTVRTAAKAVESGALGELVELRSTEQKRRVLFGKVTGPRRVELRQNGATEDDGETRLAVVGGA